MKTDYSDIVDLIKNSGKEIKWYDMNGVPRCGEYHPDLGSNANTKVLLVAKCQDCNQEFHTEYGEYTRSDEQAREFFKRFESPFANVFDPPQNIHTEDCVSGRSMTSIVVKVLKKFRLINGLWRLS